MAVSGHSRESAAIIIIMSGFFFAAVSGESTVRILLGILAMAGLNLDISGTINLSNIGGKLFMTRSYAVYRRKDSGRSSGRKEASGIFRQGAQRIFALAAGDESTGKIDEFRLKEQAQ